MDTKQWITDRIAFLEQTIANQQTVKGQIETNILQMQGGVLEYRYLLEQAEKAEATPDEPEPVESVPVELKVQKAKV